MRYFAVAFSLLMSMSFGKTHAMEDNTRSNSKSIYFGDLTNSYIENLEKRMENEWKNDSVFSTYSLFCSTEQFLEKLNQILSNSILVEDRVHLPLAIKLINESDFQTLSTKETDLLLTYIRFFDDDNKILESRLGSEINKDPSVLIHTDISMKNFPSHSESGKTRRQWLKNLANALTQRDQESFRKVSLSDFLGKTEKIPSVIKIISDAENTISWFVFQVAKHQKVDLQIKSLKDLLLIGREYLKNRNFHGVLMINLALCKFDSLIKESGLHHDKTLCEIKELMRPAKNWSAYYRATQNPKPHLPVFSLYLSNIAAIKEQIKSFNSCEHMDDKSKIDAIVKLLYPFHKRYTDSISSYRSGIEICSAEFEFVHHFPDLSADINETICDFYTARSAQNQNFFHKKRLTRSASVKRKKTQPDNRNSDEFPLSMQEWSRDTILKYFLIYEISTKDLESVVSLLANKKIKCAYDLTEVFSDCLPPEEMLNFSDHCTSIMLTILERIESELAPDEPNISKNI